MEDVEDTPDDVLFSERSRRHSKASKSARTKKGRFSSVRPSTSLTELSRGITDGSVSKKSFSQSSYKGSHRLISPDPDLPYTLEGSVWHMDSVRSLQILWSGIPVSLKIVLPEVKRTIFAFPVKYDSLVASMQDYGQRVPVRVTDNKEMLRDGLHRIAIADMCGWESMMVSTSNSRWHEWDESQIGQHYHRRDL